MRGHYAPHLTILCHVYLTDLAMLTGGGEGGSSASGNRTNARVLPNRIIGSPLSGDSSDTVIGAPPQFFESKRLSSGRSADGDFRYNPSSYMDRDRSDLGTYASERRPPHHRSENNWWKPRVEASARGSASSSSIYRREAAGASALYFTLAWRLQTWSQVFGQYVICLVHFFSWPFLHQLWLGFALSRPFINTTLGSLLIYSLDVVQLPAESFPDRGSGNGNGNGTGTGTGTGTEGRPVARSVLGDPCRSLDQQRMNSEDAEERSWRKFRAYAQRIIERGGEPIELGGEERRQLASGCASLVNSWHNRIFWRLMISILIVYLLITSVQLAVGLIYWRYLLRTPSMSAMWVKAVSSIG